jgi:excisionase family DNA binding protein
MPTITPLFDDKTRLGLILNSTPDRLALIDAVLHGQDIRTGTSLRLLRMSQAALETGLSRSTLWRAVRDGRLRAVEVRRGSHRIPEAELRRFVEGR